MSLLGVDLGGTKLALAIFDENGKISLNESFPLEGRKGSDAGKFIADHISSYLQKSKTQIDPINSIGISVPGISHAASGTVWAPNIEGWTDYPLLKEIRAVSQKISVTIDSDRACYILGEAWMGNARGCSDAIYLSVGTGIGAGILINGEVLRGSHDVAGCAGWMAIDRPFNKEYSGCGCFEYFASGEGIANTSRLLLKEHHHESELDKIDADKITAPDVFLAYDNGDKLALQTIKLCIEFWGMAIANLVSLFNPEKIILGGGVFGPAIKFIPEIRAEAAKWAQPVGFSQVSIVPSGLGGDAGVYGAAYLALKNLTKKTTY